MFPPYCIFSFLIFPTLHFTPTTERAFISVTVTRVDKPPIAIPSSTTAKSRTLQLLTLTGTDADSAITHAVIKANHYPTNGLLFALTRNASAPLGYSVIGSIPLPWELVPSNSSSSGSKVRRAIPQSEDMLLESLDDSEAGIFKVAYIYT
jgi:hypothetical protein